MKKKIGWGDYFASKGDSYRGEKPGHRDRKNDIYGSFDYTK